MSKKKDPPYNSEDLKENLWKENTRPGTNKKDKSAVNWPRPQLHNSSSTGSNRKGEKKTGKRCGFKEAQKTLRIMARGKDKTADDASP